MSYTLGVDLSHWQPEPVDWPLAIAKGVRFAFIKGANGVTQDSGFTAHWQGAKGQVLRGVYLYFLNSQSPTAQAQALFNACGGDLGELPPVLDLEEVDNPLLDPNNVFACLGELENLFGRTPLIYTRATVFDPLLGKPTWASGYDLWDANYPYGIWKGDNHISLCAALDPNVWPALPAAWKDAGIPFTFWQFTDKAPAVEFGVPGTTLDLNFFNGDEALLNTFAGIADPNDLPARVETLESRYNDLITIEATHRTLTPTLAYQGPTTSDWYFGLAPDRLVKMMGPIENGRALCLVIHPYVLKQFAYIPLAHLEALEAPVIYSVTSPVGTFPTLEAFQALQGQVTDLITRVETLESNPVKPPGVQPPASVTLKAAQKVNLFYYKDVNKQGKPIMKLPPDGQRNQFFEGELIAANPAIVDADSTLDYWEVINVDQASPPAGTPPAGFTGWFVRDDQVLKL